MCPLISICLCAWNDAHYLDLLLRSIQETCEFSHEVCIIDNGSEDHINDVLKKYPQVKSEHLPKNRGSQAVNHAVEMSSGKYIIKASSDMIFVRKAIFNAFAYHKYLEKKYQTDRISVSSTLIEPTGGRNNGLFVKRDFGTDYQSAQYEKILSVNDINLKQREIFEATEPMLMKRTLWDLLSGISDDYPFPGVGNDLDFGLKLLAHKATSRLCRSAFVYHFVSKTRQNIPEQDHKADEANKVFLDKWGITFQDYFDMKRDFERTASYQLENFILAEQKIQDRFNKIHITT